MPTESESPPKLTTRQREIVGFIGRYWRDHGYGPSTRDFCRQFGWSSPNAVIVHMKSLQKKNIATWSPKVARSFRLVQSVGGDNCPCCGQSLKNDPDE